MGDSETRALALAESTLKYHPYDFWILTEFNYLESRQSVVGSLTGAVASQKVTEALKGSLRLVGNQSKSVLV